MQIQALVYSIGLTLSPFAAIAAFIITYDEYKHHYAHKKKVRMTAFRQSFFTLCVSVFITVLLANVIHTVTGN